MLNDKPTEKPVTDIALDPRQDFALEAQDRPSGMSWGRALTIGLSLFVLGAALWQATKLDLSQVASLIPSSPAFWLVFGVTYLVGPASNFLIFRMLWHVGPSGFTASIRKVIYNELLLGYLGEVYFYTWARRNVSMETTPFGAVKDVAILSAIAGNITTLLLIALAYPFVDLLPLDEHARAIAWSLAFLIGTSLIPFIWRRRIFSLARGELSMVFAVHMGRILLSTLLTALLWHLVLPDVQIGWWFVLAAIRLLVGRLPFVTNKEIVFAGIAVLALGEDIQLAALIAMMAALTLATHLVTALIFGLYDLMKGDRP